MPSKMNWFTFAFGIFALGFGLFTIYARLKFPERFGKLEAMKEMYGHKRGTNLHIFSYTVVPIVTGILMIFASTKGISVIGN